LAGLLPKSRVVRDDHNVETILGKGAQQLLGCKTRGGGNDHIPYAVPLRIPKGEVEGCIRVLDPRLFEIHLLTLVLVVSAFRTGVRADPYLGAGKQ